ncbi:PH domain-containing protein [Streptomyces sp. NPDC059743]|uniref:PH domain-containing protein n=1 Tax=Streptomyces sp. NPDC059743 TaxID=3346928 RepID=UPI00365128E3
MTEPAVLEGRLHPITPWRRALATITGAVLFFFRDAESWVKSAEGWPRWVLALAAAAVSLAGAVYGYLSWRKTSYQLTDDALHVRTGILFHRRHRFVLDHLQAADVHRPLLGRWIGVCSLRLSVSGQSATLSYLSEADASALRSALLRRMSGDTPAASEQVAESEELAEPPLLVVPARRLALSILLEAHTMVRAGIAVIGGLVPYLIFHEPLALLSLAGSAGAVWKMTYGRWPRYHGWTLTAAPGGYRAEYGLLDRRHQTYRHQRTQAVTLVQPLLWRRRGWVQILVSTAGYHHPLLLAPVATLAEAERLIADLYGPDGVQLLNTQTPAPRRARWATPWSHVLSCSVSSDHVSVWHGLFLRNVRTLCPTSKTQNIVTSQGPWQRRLGLATVHLAVAGGPVLSGRHRDAGEAQRIASRMLTLSRTTRLPARDAVLVPGTLASRDPQGAAS